MVVTFCQRVFLHATTIWDHYSDCSKKSKKFCSQIRFYSENSGDVRSETPQPSLLEEFCNPNALFFNEANNFLFFSILFAPKQ